jgi:hypothetical protein
MMCITFNSMQAMRCCALALPDATSGSCTHGSLSAIASSRRSLSTSTM